MVLAEMRPGGRCGSSDKPSSWTGSQSSIVRQPSPRPCVWWLTVSREDCFHLSHALPYFVPGSEEYQTSLDKVGTGLTDVFRAFAEKRQPRTSALVKGA